MSDNKSIKELFQQAREIDKQEQLEKEKKDLEENQKKLAEEEKQREEYAGELHKDKIELLKSKNGISETDMKGDSEIKNYTFKEKISNFFYHNKWWLGIGTFLILLTGYIIFDVATKVEPDISIMLLSNDERIYQSTFRMQEFFGEYVGDRNEDGEVKINIFYMPLSEYLYNYQPEIYMSSTTQLNAMLQTDESLIIIADEESSKLLWEDEILLNIDKYYPDNENVKESGFYLSKTDFPKLIGYDDSQGEMGDDVYMGIRKVDKEASYEESMREKFKEDFKIFQQIIEDLS